MNKRTALSAILLLVGGLLLIHAQENVNSSGGTGSGNGGTMSYSTGQLFYSMYSSSSGSVSEGVQLPFKISVIKSIKEADVITLNCMVFPNPAGDWLNLKVDDTELGNLSFRLIDLGGRTLIDKKIFDVSTSISMQYLSAGPYILKVFQKRTEIKSFKIIKN